jgi:hypothetical protein
LERHIKLYLTLSTLRYEEIAHDESGITFLRLLLMPDAMTVPTDHIIVEEDKIITVTGR